MSDAATDMEKEIKHERLCRENLNKWSIDKPLYERGTKEYKKHLEQIFYAASDLQYNYTMSYKMVVNLVTRYPELYDFKYEPGFKVTPDNIFDCINEKSRDAKNLEIIKNVIKNNLKNLRNITEAVERLEYCANVLEVKNLTETKRNKLCKQIYKDVKFLTDDCYLYVNVDNVEKICNKLPELYYRTKSTFGLLQCVDVNHIYDINYIYQNNIKNSQERLKKKFGSHKKYMKPDAITKQSENHNVSKAFSNKDRTKA